MAWLANWCRRKLITMNQKAGAGTNYQILIKVYRGAGADGTETVDNDSGVKVYCGGNCRNDFGDIRFTASDGSTLWDCWREEISAGNYAIYWLELRDNLSSGNVQFYIYYDNAVATYPYLATELAHGEATFIIFDDFEDGAYDVAKWSTQGANVTEAGGKLRVDPTVQGGGVRSQASANLGEGRAMKARVAWEQTYDQQGSIGFLSMSGVGHWWGQSLLFIRDYKKTSNHWELLSGQPWEFSVSPNNTDDGNPHKYCVKGKTNQVAILWHDSWGPWSPTDTVDNVTYYWWISKGYNTYNNEYMDIFWAFLRKWVPDDPTWNSTGAEQVNLPAAPTGISASCTSPTTPYQITVTWNDNATNETGYTVQRDDGGWHTIANLGAGATSYVDAVTCDVNYLYRVRAWNACGNSTWNTLGSTVRCICYVPPIPPEEEEKQHITDAVKEWEYDYVFRHTPTERIVGTVTLRFSETKKIMGRMTRGLFEETRQVKSKIAKLFEESQPISQKILLIEFDEEGEIVGSIKIVFRETNSVLADVASWILQRSEVFGETKSVEEDILEEIRRMEKEDFSLLDVNIPQKQRARKKLLRILQEDEEEVD